MNSHQGVGEGKSGDYFRLQGRVGEQNWQARLELAHGRRRRFRGAGGSWSYRGRPPPVDLRHVHGGFCADDIRVDASAVIEDGAEERAGRLPGPRLEVDTAPEQEELQRVGRDARLLRERVAFFGEIVGVVVHASGQVGQGRELPGLDGVLDVGNVVGLRVDKEAGGQSDRLSPTPVVDGHLLVNHVPCASEADVAVDELRELGVGSEPVDGRRAVLVVHVGQHERQRGQLALLVLVRTVQHAERHLQGETAAAPYLPPGSPDLIGRLGALLGVQDGSRIGLGERVKEAGGFRRGKEGRRQFVWAASGQRRKLARQLLGVQARVERRRRGGCRRRGVRPVVAAAPGVPGVPGI